MGRITVKGIEGLQEKIYALSEKTHDIVGSSLYGGMKIIADEIRREIDALPVIYNEEGWEEEKVNGITIRQKKGLQDGFGVAQLRNDNGFENVQAGFEGYNSIVTKKYPKGQPNALIARSVESGTSFRQKNPFFSRAVKKTRKQAIEKMKEIVEEEIKKANK